MIGWTNANAAQLREFLGTKTGSLLLQGMREVADGMPDGHTIEEEALLAREAKGARRQLEIIRRAAEFEETPIPQPEDIDLEKAIE